MIKKLLILFPLVVIQLSCAQEKAKSITEDNTNAVIVKSTNNTDIVIKKDTLSQSLIDSLELSKTFILGKYNLKTDKHFITVQSIHASKSMYLNKVAYEQFKKMYNAAKKDGVNLKIISGTRNFYAQKAIWNRKWQKYEALSPKDRALKILEYSSMPGTSRHHWGTDIDLNNLNNSFFEKGEGLKI